MSSCARPAFVVWNHAKEKKGKARMVINYKHLTIIISLMATIFLTKKSFSTDFKEPFGSWKWIAKAVIGK